MEELIRQLSSILRGMWKHRWPALILAWVVAIIGTVVVFRVPDSYEASARIFVDTQSILKPLMSGLAVQPNIDQQVSMLSRTLISRPNIEKLIRMADLDLKSATKAQQEQLVENLMKKVEIRSTGRDNLYTLSYAEADKDRAKRVIQSMVSIFVESSLGASRKDTDSAKVFLDEQIKSYEKQLEEAEARLKEFRMRNIDVQLGADGKDAASRLAEAAQTLAAAKLELREAEDSREAIKRQMQAAPASAAGASASAPEPVVNVATPEIDARIETQKRNLDGLLQRYTDLHPDVVNTRRLIRELEEQKKREVAELRKAGVTSPLAGSLPGALPGSGLPGMGQELSRMLATSEMQVAALKARVSEYQGRYNDAKGGMKIAPQIEAEAAQLNRDYGVIKRNYETLVTRRQSAAMSGELEMASGVVDFRLIDPPRVSPRPVSPNRIVLILAVLGVSVASGMGLAFAASQLRPVYLDAQQLREKTGLPLLGVVGMVVSEDARRRDRMNNFRFAAGTGGLFAGFLLVLVTVSILAARQVG